MPFPSCPKTPPSQQITTGHPNADTLFPQCFQLSDRCLFLSDNPETLASSYIGTPAKPADVLCSGSVQFSNGKASVRAYIYHAKPILNFADTCYMYLFVSMSSGTAHVVPGSVRHRCDVRDATSSDGHIWHSDDAFTSSGLTIATAQINRQLFPYEPSSYSITTARNDLVVYSLTGSTTYSQFFIVSVIEFDVIQDSGSGELQIWSSMVGATRAKPAFDVAIEPAFSNPRGLWLSDAVMSVAGPQVIGPPKKNPFSFAVPLARQEPALYPGTPDMQNIRNAGIYGVDVLLIVTMTSKDLIYSVQSQLGNAWDNGDPFALATLPPPVTWPIFLKKTNAAYPVSYTVYPQSSGIHPTTASLLYAIAGGAGCPGSFQFSIVGWQAVNSSTA